jgi:hypothetical protein
MAEVAFLRGLRQRGTLVGPLSGLGFGFLRVFLRVFRVKYTVSYGFPFHPRLTSLPRHPYHEISLEFRFGACF